MKALRITGRGGPEVLRLDDVADPEPGAWDVRIRVRAAALNRADLLQCLGRYPAPPGAPPDIPGLEYAGEIEDAGRLAQRFRPGDRVMGILAGGAFAERVIAHEREVIPMPRGMEFRDAAALPEALMTAYDALVLQGELRSGEAVLVHAVASGVGTAASQLVCALGGTVIGTSRSQDKLRRVEALGVKHGLCVDSEPPRFADRVRELSGGRGADLVLDLVGGSYLPETLAACAARGRVLLVGTLAGPTAEIPLATVLQRRLRIQGTVLRTRPLEEKILAARAFERSVLPLLERGALRPVVDEVFPFGEARAALGKLAGNLPLGKVVLAW